jgi:hypothetical protein
MATYSVGDRGRRHLLMMSAVLAVCIVVSPHQAGAQISPDDIHGKNPCGLYYTYGPGGPVCHMIVSSQNCKCSNLKPAHIGERRKKVAPTQ